MAFRYHFPEFICLKTKFGIRSVLKMFTVTNIVLTSLHAYTNIPMKASFF